MRKIIVACGALVMALVFAASPADAAKKRPIKRDAPVVKVPSPAAPKGFCIPPNNHC